MKACKESGDVLGEATMLLGQGYAFERLGEFGRAECLYMEAVCGDI